MKSLLLLLIFPVVLCEEGKQFCEVNSRIFGGKYAEEGEFPGAVYLSIEVREWNDTIADWDVGQFGCAGSLISDRWVLTAAHCIYSHPPLQFLSISVQPTKESPYSIQSREEIPHPGYWSNGDDIGLIWLPQPMSSINRNSKPVSLPLQDQELTSNEVTLIGWGITSTSEEEVPSKLMKAEHVPLNQTLCRLIDRSENDVLCRYPTESTGGTCHGDSGGPIFMDGLQVGVVSGAKQLPFSPAIIHKDTRVSAYRNWIDAQTGLNMS